MKKKKSLPVLLICDVDVAKVPPVEVVGHHCIRRISNIKGENAADAFYGDKCQNLQKIETSNSSPPPRPPPPPLIPCHQHVQ